MITPFQIASKCPSPLHHNQDTRPMGKDKGDGGFFHNRKPTEDIHGEP
jgi:hypothetical protein